MLAGDLGVVDSMPFCTGMLSHDLWNVNVSGIGNGYEKLTWERELTIILPRSAELQLGQQAEARNMVWFLDCSRESCFLVF
jgi:hypothetical protein